MLRVKYLSMRQAESQLKIPMSHLKRIRRLYPDGFTANGSVKRIPVSKYYADNKDLIIKVENEDEIDLKKQKLQNQVILQEIQIAEAKKESIAVKEVDEFMQNFGIQLGAVLRTKLTKELPPQVAGLSEENVSKYCKDFYNELVALFNKNIENWKSSDGKAITE